MRKGRIDPQKVLGRCAWCRRRIGKNTPVFVVWAKARPGMLGKDQEGTGLAMFLVKAKRTVYGIVPRSDSPAKKDGKDLLFQVCSDCCGQALQQAFQDELDMADEVR